MNSLVTRTLLALSVLIGEGLTLSQTSQAASQAATQSLEAPRFAKLLYRAKLQWIPGAVEATDREYRFELGVAQSRTEKAGTSRIQAVIRDGDRIVGLCHRDLSRRRSVQRDEIAMRCTGHIFGTKTVAARFRFDSRLPRPQLDVELRSPSPPRAFLESAW